ncbi:MAG TPA: ATP-dependent Clp protease adaptor ClpS [Candidatus Nanopelagicales bacterium]|nr:ATP-dependent Clp protease adaptor ClpS [Candidatus Nanopelagicales bacterium]
MVDLSEIMGSEPRRVDDGDGDLAVKPERKVEKARRYQVVFHNDDYTTKWFVVDVLMHFFHMSEATATAFMIAVHKSGRGVAGVYTKDIAETKAAQVLEHAREYGMPLRLTVEPDDD